MVRWWRVEKGRSHPSLAGLDALLSSRTKIVALTHVSNVLGRVCDVSACAALCKQRSPGVHVVVDGVAYVPHRFADLNVLQSRGVDWYAVSLHKLYGPHLGAIVGRVRSPRLEGEEEETEAEGTELGRKRKRLPEKGDKHIQKTIAGRVKVARHDETQTCPVGPRESHALACGQHQGSGVVLGDTLGTVSLEACAGVRGLEEYFQALGQGRGMAYAWARIKAAESGPQAILLEALRKSKRVRVLGDEDNESNSAGLICGERLPTISFVHSHYSAREIVTHALEAGVAGRCGNFLAPRLLAALGDDVGDTVVRFSLCHYNNEEEVRHLMAALEGLAKW